MTGGSGRSGRSILRDDYPRAIDRYIDYFSGRPASRDEPPDQRTPRADESHEPRGH